MRENFKYLSIFKFILIAFVFYGCNNNKQSELPDPNWFNVDYSGENHISQKMDIYLPKIKKKHPPVIVIYGSGWSSNNKKFSDYQKKFLLNHFQKRDLRQLQ